jgi:drug/metabolite transporter (DMT)-like permease
MPFVGELSALMTATLWAGGSIALAAVARRAGTNALNISRLLIAAVYLCAVVWVAGLDTNLSRAQIGLLAVSGVIGFAFGDTFLFKAFRDIGPRLSMLIMSTSPAIAALLAYLFLDESLSFLGVVGILVTVLGVAIVVLEQNTRATAAVDWRGLFYAVLGSTGQGVGLIFAKMAFLRGDMNGFVATLVRVVASLCVMIPLGMVATEPFSGFKIFLSDRRILGLTALGAALGPFLGVSFSLIAVSHTSVGVASAIMATVPILMLPLVRIVQKERLSWKAIAGAFVAVGGVVILFLR